MTLPSPTSLVPSANRWLAALVGYGLELVDIGAAFSIFVPPPLVGVAGITTFDVCFAVEAVAGRRSADPPAARRNGVSSASRVASRRRWQWAER